MLKFDWSIDFTHVFGVADSLSILGEEYHLSTNLSLITKQRPKTNPHFFPFSMGLCFHFFLN